MQLTLKALYLVAISAALGFGCRDQTPLEPAEAWDVVYLGDARIGHTVTRCRRIRHRGQPAWQWTQETALKVQRFGEPSTQQIVATSVQGLNGQLLQSEWQLVSGQSKLAARAVPDGARLRLTTDTAGESREAEIPWQADWGGLFVIEQSLRQQPMKAGESRTVCGLAPLLNRLVTTRLEAVGYEQIDLLQETQSLLRVEATAMAGEGVEIKSTMWVDYQGQSWKTVLPALNQKSYRVPREIALSTAEEPAADIARETMVPVSRPLPHPHRTRRAVYRVRLKYNSPALYFAHHVSQSVEEVNELEALVTVTAVRPRRPPSVAKPRDLPRHEDLAATSLIQCDDPVLGIMSREVEPFGEDAWQIAVALERYVNRKIKTKDFSTAFASASEVAQSLRGDCTEHAVLLAALCRSRKIPCRVAVGLIYTPSAGGFGFHMWNEVWMSDRWVPLDATLGRGGIGAAHLKISDSVLNDTDTFAALLPVLKLMGQMEIDVVEFE